MKKLNYNYSYKNIPTPDKQSYLLLLTEKIHSVIKRIRWKTHFFLNVDENDTQNRETFGFKSRNPPPQNDALDEFEREAFEIVNKILFKETNDEFQTKLKADIEEIQKSPNIFVFADKTNNLYELTPDEHKKILSENVTKTYRKAHGRIEQAINAEASQIAAQRKLDDRIDRIAHSEAYVTLKDHKENFRSNPACRLINPAKSELGKISKAILERINKELVEQLSVQQWKNTKQVLSWFEAIEKKEECTFVQLDIKEFYPSITSDTLDKAIEFAKQKTTISDEEVRAIKHCRKSLLFNSGEAWRKKATESLFDVTMGSFDGAEICELVGTFILSKLTTILPKENAGLYRDDGLIVLRGFNAQRTDRMRKEIVKTFKSFGFSIEIEANLKEVDFLDVTLNLTEKVFRPYKKPNDKILYVHTSSNHPPNILKQLPQSIAERLAQNSSNETVFNETKPEYEDALKQSGYTDKLAYKKNVPKASRNRSRNIIWFNPPYNKNVETKVAQVFLKLIDKHFGKNSALHKILNRNNVKVSYSCTRNFERIVKSHNANVGKTKPKEAGCNCQRSNKPNCPLPGNCKVEDVVYNCEVASPEKPTKLYIGLASGKFKLRYGVHKSSFQHRHLAKTTLAKYIWELKDAKAPYTLKWSVKKRVAPYTNITKRCALCLVEKFEILTSKHPHLLNKRSELLSKCLHERKFLLNYNG